MPLYPSTDKRPVYFSKQGVPLVYGRIFYYEVDGITKKTVYSDRLLTVPAANSQLLNLFGRTDTEIFLGTGQYTCKSYEYTGTGTGTEPENDPLWVEDNQWDDSGADVAAITTGEALVVETISALRNFPVGGTIVTTGYYQNLDRMPVTYTWNPASVAVENYGTVIKSSVSGTGAWICDPGAEVDAKIFGMGIQSTPPANSLWTQWGNYCTSTRKTGRMSGGTYTFSYSGATILDVTWPVIFDAGALILNDAAGSLELTISNQATQIYTSGDIAHGSTVGPVQFTFPLLMSYDIEPKWFGYVQSVDATDIAPKMFDGQILLDNTVRIDGNFSVVNYTGTGNVPRLRFVDHGVFSLDFVAGNYLTFYDVITSKELDSGLNIQGSGAIFTGIKGGYLPTSWFINSQDFEILSHASIPTIIVDSNCTIYNATTLPEIATGGGIMTGRANLTVGKVIGNRAFWKPYVAGTQHLIVTAQAYDPAWYDAASRTLSIMFGDCCVDGASYIIDFGATDPVNWGPADATWDMSGNNMLIKGLKTTSSTSIRFRPVGLNVAQITMEDCDITTNHSGEFINGDLLTGLKIYDSSINCKNYYTPSNPTNYGRFCTSFATTGIQIENSVITASRLYEGTVAYFLSKGTQHYGTMDIGATGSILFQSSNVGTTDSVYYTGNALKLSGGGLTQISDSTCQRADLCFYSNAVGAVPGLININVTGLTMLPSGLTYPVIKLIAQTAGSYVQGVVFDGITFGLGSANGIKTIESIQISTSGSGSFVDTSGLSDNLANSVHNLSVNNVSVSSPYIKCTTRGTFRSTVSAVFTTTTDGTKARGTVGPTNVYDAKALVIPSADSSMKHAYVTMSASTTYNGSTTPEDFLYSVLADPSANTSTAFGYVLVANDAFTGRTRSVDITGNWSLYGS
jgi:hypothetical protein